MKIKFYEKVDDEKLLFAVIVAKYKEQWVFCKHKQRNSYESVSYTHLDVYKRQIKHLVILDHHTMICVS